MRAEVAELVGKPATFAERLVGIDADYARELEVLLAAEDAPVRLDADGGLHLSPLAAEIVDPAVLAVKDGVLATVWFVKSILVPRRNGRPSTGALNRLGVVPGIDGLPGGSTLTYATSPESGSGNHVRARFSGRDPASC